MPVSATSAWARTRGLKRREPATQAQAPSVTTSARPGSITTPVNMAPKAGFQV